MLCTALTLVDLLTESCSAKEDETSYLMFTDASHDNRTCSRGKKKRGNKLDNMVECKQYKYSTPEKLRVCEQPINT